MANDTGQPDPSDVRPTPGGMYDYYLGGSDHTPVDAEAAARVAAKLPAIRDMAQGNRLFVQRATRWLVNQGIRQFIDVGAGNPTLYNTHEVAHGIAPDARVVYVDNNPDICAKARTLLQDVENVTYVIGDICDPPSIVDNVELRELIDFAQPVGLLETAVYHFVSDDNDPRGLVRQYVNAVPAGSYLALSHITYDDQDAGQIAAAVEIYKRATAQGYPRSVAEIRRFFDGLHLVAPYDGAEPDMTWCNKWMAPDPDRADITGSWIWAGVAQKP